jgi:hypothetical protein
MSEVEAELLALFQKEREAFANRFRVKELELNRKSTELNQQRLMLADFSVIHQRIRKNLIELKYSLDGILGIIESDRKIASADPGIEEIENLRYENKRLETEIAFMRKRHSQAVDDFKSFASILNESNH